MAGFWLRSGLHRFQVVRCVVTGHRDRFGVEVRIISPIAGGEAFVDFVLLTDDGGHLPPGDFPVVGTVMDAIVLDFMPDGELRLDARPSAVAGRKQSPAPE